MPAQIVLTQCTSQVCMLPPPPTAAQCLACLLLSAASKFAADDMLAVFIELSASTLPKRQPARATDLVEDLLGTAW